MLSLFSRTVPSRDFGVGGLDFICKFSCQQYYVAFDRLESNTPLTGPIV